MYTVCTKNIPNFFLCYCWKDRESKLPKCDVIHDLTSECHTVLIGLLFRVCYRVVFVGVFVLNSSFVPSFEVPMLENTMILRCERTVQTLQSLFLTEC